MKSTGRKTPGALSDRWVRRRIELPAAGPFFLKKPGG